MPVDSIDFFCPANPLELHTDRPSCRKAMYNRCPAREGGAVASEPLKAQHRIQLGEGVELDPSSDELSRGGRVFKLERIPAAVLLLLVEKRGQVVRRDEIVERIWGKDVFLDTDNGINSAIRKIRQALKDDSDSPRFIQTITGKGYRFIAPVPSLEAVNEQEPTSAVSSAGSDPGVIEDRDASLQIRQLRIPDQNHLRNRDVPGAAQEPAVRTTGRPLAALAVAGLALVCLVALLVVWARREASTSSASPISSTKKIVLAVLPFDNLSHNPDQEFFSDGLTEEMIAQVGKLNRDRLIVIARSSVAKYKGSKLDARQVGKELNVDYLVQGSVRRSADRVRVTVQLIQPQNQTDIWTESYDRELRDVLAVQDSIVQNIASQIHIALTEEEKTRFANPRNTPPEAYQAYLKGRYYWNKRTGDGMEKAAQYFQQAIDGDPTYAEAYSGLADCNSGLSWHGFKSPADGLPKAYAAARKAIEINPRSAEAHASLGLVFSHRWEWPGAEAEFKQAIELDPQYANAHHWYGDYLSMMGRHQDALAEARRALQLDPLNLMISSWVGLRYYLAHNYSAAIAQNRSSVDLNSNFAAAHLLLGKDYIQAGRPTDAVSELQTATRESDSPLYKAQLAVSFAAAGQTQEAQRIAQELELLSRTRYVSPYGLAQIYAALDDKQRTFEWLQAAYDDHAVWMGYLAVDPTFERYHSDQRFQGLLRRVGVR